MRKLFTLMMFVVMVVAANAADYYLIGGFNSWKLKDSSAKFTDQGDGTYVLDYAGTLTSGFKINDGTWTNGNANFGGSATLVLGETYSLTTGSSSGNITMSENVANPHLVFNPTAKTLVVTGQSQEATVKYGIHGDIFGVTAWSTEDFTEKEGKWVMENKTIVAGIFGIKVMDAATGSQPGWIASAGADAVVLDTPMTCKADGTNWSIDGGTFTFTFDPEAMTLTVSGQSVAPEYPEHLYVVGNVNNGDFAANNTVALAKGASEGTYEGKVTFTGALGTDNSYFGLSTATGATAADWNGLGTRYGAPVADAVPSEEPSAIVKGDKSWKVANGTVTVKVSLVDMTISVIGGSEPDPEVPAALYIIGNVNGTAWSTEIPVEMTREGNKFTAEAVVDDAGEGFGYFSFCTVAGADWDTVNSGDRFGPAADDTSLAVDSPAEMILYKEGVNASACKSWKVAASDEGHKYMFTADFDAMTVKVDMLSGIASVDSENASEAVYYNLQGVRVDNPANGVFVRVAGGKATKVVK